MNYQIQRCPCLSSRQTRAEDDLQQIKALARFLRTAPIDTQSINK